MGYLDTLEGGDEYKWEDQTRDQRDLVTQSIISIALGLIAFLTFCVLRPKWRSLYAARKRQKDAASRLPELPQTFFGWIPTLYKITEEEVLAAAGLDAFVFLSFFKMAIKFLMFTLFFSLVVILPVQVHYTGEYAWHRKDNGTDDMQSYVFTPQTSVLNQGPRILGGGDDDLEVPKTGFLWIYVVFVYLFSAYAIYLLVTETTKIIRIRQDLLGSQSTITDRTFRLSGIPPDLRSEEKIKGFLEDLGIGNVESVMVCRDWKELDDLLERRMSVLRKLEEAWTVHLGHRREQQRRGSLSTAQSAPPRHTHDGDDEYDNDRGRLLADDDTERNHVMPYSQARPTTRIWYGFLNLESKKIDAIDYYEEKLRKLDDQIKMVRKKDFQPTPLAFVTMDTTASCQMAVQAILDPAPMQLLANLAPAPSDVIWQNTYVSRRNRMLRAWSVTAIIVVLTLFWSALLAPLAGLLSLDSIRKVAPQLADVLDRSPISRTLVQTGLPTLLVSLLNVAVPYLYDWLANMQGMISQGEVELSLISKNFFFTFFNLFGVLTIFGTFSKFYGFYDNFQEVFKELSTTQLAYALASSLERLAPFYVNLIVLQGLGLFPFRLLEFGSVATYPIYLVGAKTPRDYADLEQPPIFNYGFYLPQTILIFIICTVYSVLPGSWLVLFFGLVYFVLGSFIYKYQLLYAMDHRQHSTGKAWPIICNRVILGLVVFQIAIAGDLALKTAIKRSVLIIPLLMGTIWFSYFYRKSYEPLMKFIALRSIDRNERFNGADRGESRYDSETDHGRTVDEAEETGKRFINPNLIIPLEDVWIAKKRTTTNNHVLLDDGDENSLDDRTIDFAHPSRAFEKLGSGSAVTTSSQILLSRGVADPYPAPSPTSSSPAAPPIVSIFESDSVHLMTLGSPVRPTGYRYSRSATYRAFSLHELQRAGSSETTDWTMHTTMDHWETSSVSVTDSAMEGSNTAISSPERPNSVQWIASDVSSRSSDHRDNSDGPSTLTSSPSTPSSGAHSPVRGRPLDISSLHHGLISRETVRRRAGPTSVEFDTTLMQQRIASRDFTAELDSRHDSTLLDAYPAGRDYRSASEAFFGHTVHGFAGHRDTFALLVGLPKLAPEMPLEFFYCLRRYISHADYLSVRLSCREWSAAISYVSPPKLPAVYFVPLEIVQQIYGYLRPVDFNAARHTCRAWMFASLETQLLTCMLKRGGWGDLVVDAPVYDPLNADGEATSQEWALSKLLARECALGPNWTGNGLRSTVSSFDCHAARDSPEPPLVQDGCYTGIRSDWLSDMPPNLGNHLTGLVQTARADFSAVGTGSARDDEHGAAVNFTVSVCGKYLVVAEGCMIFIYRLSSDERISDDGVSPVGLTAVTSVICPRRVLATSMDTSSQRFAVAALLDGRMGLVCDLDETLQYQGTRSSLRRMHHNSSGFHVSVSPSSLSSPLDRAFVRSSGSSGEREITEPAVRGSGYFDASPDSQASDQAQCPVPGRSRSAVPGAFAREPGVGLETGPRSIYKNLCSDDDPPRSVAICPQRRCVAFGCSAGIELHWVDALTGQDLNRWFPLTAPSDFLYFLPPRKGVDSAKKLRLISSAAHPNEKPAVRHHFYPAQTMAHMMFGPLRFIGQLSGMQAVSDCDHYRAMPLSDGNHILFTDPASGMLCLGNDAPLGGPTKLLRKITLVGPDGCVPSVYAAGTELRWGVRVVIGYGDRVFLFSIPPDIFRDSQFVDSIDLSSRDDSWHLYHDNAPCNYGEAEACNLWPVKIHGTEIGRVPSLSDLAVDSSPVFTIWAFSANGEAFIWEIADGSPKRMKTIRISQDGSVDAATDLEGDTIMAEAPSLSCGEEGFESFDGAASVEFRAASYLGPRVGFERLSSGREGGDVEMTDADADINAGKYHDGDSEFAQAGGSFAISILQESARWSEVSADWVPDSLRSKSLDDGTLSLLGVVGLECEIL